MSLTHCETCGADLDPGRRECPACGAAPREASLEELTLSPSAQEAAPELDDEATLTPSAVSSGDVGAPHDAPASAPSANRIGERYEVVKELGRGGMGIVYLARDLRFANELGGVKRQVVVKRVLTEDRSALDRFRRETAAIAVLDHENIVPILDFGEDARGPYLVMTHLEGGSLRRLVLSKGPLDSGDFYHLARALGRALQHVHERGILHRDVKPSNVLLTRDGLAKLADFGLVRVGEERSELSSLGAALGTADYAAPEQLRGEPVDERADLYGLGATLYFAITSDSPRTVRESRLPGDWRALILRLLEELPARRFHSAAEFLVALENARESSTTPASAGGSLVCPECSASNAEDAHYCRRCGSGLVAPCPSCDAVVELVARFCPACGLDTHAWRDSEALRRESVELLRQARIAEALDRALAADAALSGRAQVHDLIVEVRRQHNALENALDSARHLDGEERYEEARLCWERVLELVPEHEAASEALESFERRVRERDERRALSELDDALARGLLPAAQGALERCLFLFGPRDQRLTGLRDRVAELAARVDRWRAEFESAIEERSLGGAQRAAGNLEGAGLPRDELRAIRARVVSLKAHNRILRLLEHGDLRAALELFRRLEVHAGEEDKELLPDLGRRVARHRQEHVEGLRRSFARSLSDGRFDDALELLSHARKILGEDPVLDELREELHRRVRRRRARGARLRLTAVLLLLVGGLAVGYERVGHWLGARVARAAESMKDGDLAEAGRLLELPGWLPAKRLPYNQERRRLAQQLRVRRELAGLPFRVSLEDAGGRPLSDGELLVAVEAQWRAHARQRLGRQEFDELAAELGAAVADLGSWARDLVALLGERRRILSVHPVARALDGSTWTEILSEGGLDAAGLRERVGLACWPEPNSDGELERLDMLAGLVTDEDGRLARRLATRRAELGEYARAESEAALLADMADGRWSDFDAHVRGAAGVLSQDDLRRWSSWGAALRQRGFHPRQAAVLEELTARYRDSPALASIRADLEGALRAWIAPRVPRTLVVDAQGATELPASLGGFDLRLAGAEVVIAGGKTVVREPLREGRSDSTLRIATSSLAVVCEVELVVDRTPAELSLAVRDPGDDFALEIVAEEPIRLVSVALGDEVLAPEANLRRRHLLEGLPLVSEPGPHRVVVRAVDIASNPSSLEVELELPSRSVLEFEQALAIESGLRDAAGRLEGVCLGTGGVVLAEADGRAGRFLDRVFAELNGALGGPALLAGLERAAAVCDEVRDATAFLEGVSPSPAVRARLAEVAAIRRDAHDLEAALRAESLSRASLAEWLQRTSTFTGRVRVPDRLRTWWRLASRLEDGRLEVLRSPEQVDWEAQDDTAELPDLLRHRTGILLRRLPSADGGRELYMAVRLVSAAQWMAGKGAPVPGTGTRNAAAATGHTWSEVDRWCRAHGLDLPTASEWRWAAVGRAQDPEFSGTSWFAQPYPRAVDAGNADESWAGIRDMQGNLSELCRADPGTVAMCPGWSPVIGGSHLTVAERPGRLRWVPPASGSGRDVKRYYRAVGFRPVLR